MTSQKCGRAGEREGSGGEKERVEDKKRKGRGRRRDRHSDRGRDTNRGNPGNYAETSLTKTETGKHNYSLGITVKEDLNLAI